MYKASPFSRMSNHVSESACAYHEDGCTFTSCDAGEMEDHMRTAAGSHLIMAAIKKQHQQTCQVFDSYVETIMEKLVSLESVVSRLHNYVEWEITSGQSRLTEELREVNRKQESLEGKVSKLHRQMSWEVAEELKKISRNQEFLDESLDDALQNRRVERHLSSIKATTFEDELKEISMSQETLANDVSELRQNIREDVAQCLKTIGCQQERMRDSLDEIQHKQEVLSGGLDRLQEGLESRHDTNVDKEMHTPVLLHESDPMERLVPAEDDVPMLVIPENNRLDKLEATVDQLEGKVSLATDLTVESGTFLWRVHNFSKLLEKGRSKGEFYIYSAEFFSESKGYKMCLFMCPNGHMEGRDSHVSLYLQLLSGPYDDELDWPFKEVVSMETLDLSGTGKHRKYSFEPCLQQPELECWLKPRKDRRNTGYGNHRFLAHAHLEADSHFLREDTLYVRVNIG